MEMAKSVEEYIESSSWKKELTFLREIILSTGLTEDLKWGIPAYIYKGKNLMGIAAFKNYVGIWFHQGVFLKDDAKVLMNAQEGKTKAMRQWRFNSIDEIDPDLVKAYVFEAIENHRAGLEIKPVRSKTYEMSPYLEDFLNNNAEVKQAFFELTFGKQKEYSLYVLEAKQESTKQNRLKKIIPMIINGAGLHDKYK